MGRADSDIALPVSPTVLFVAAHDPAFARSLAGWKQTELVKVLNKAIVCHARIGTWRPSSSIFQAGTSGYSLAFPPRGD